MEPHMEYFAGGEETLSRLRRLYVDRDQTLVLAAMGVPSPTVAEFRRTHSAGFSYDFPDPAERAAFWDSLLRERAAVRDDSVPNAYLTEMDQALYGGLVGGKARFLCNPDTGWISSMVEPVLGDLAEASRLHFDAQGEWRRWYMDELSAFAKAAGGRFGISHFILIDGLNFAFELVGATKTYEEMIDRPELVRRVADFAFDLNVKVQRIFFERVPLHAGGTCSNMVQWMPGRIVSESVDPFHMTSAACFEEWGRANVERIFAAFDGGVVHIHGNGRHLLRAVASLKGLRAVCIGDDRGYPRAFDVLPDLKARLGTMPVIVSVGREAFEAAMRDRRLPGGAFYNVWGLPDADAANRLMDRVRAYRA